MFKSHFTEITTFVDDASQYLLGWKIREILKSEMRCIKNKDVIFRDNKVAFMIIIILSHNAYKVGHHKKTVNENEVNTKIRFGILRRL